MTEIDVSELPAWARRALDPSTPTGTARETVRTMSMDGKLFPTIRMKDGKLVRMEPKEAFEEAVKRRDFIQFDSEEAATAFSKKLSAMIPSGNRKRSIIAKSKRD